MSIISSNHIDLKSNSIWGLYEVSKRLCEDCNYILKKQTYFEYAERTEICSQIFMSPDRTYLELTYFSINWHRKSKPVVNFMPLTFSSKFIYFSGLTTVEDVQKFIFMNISHIYDWLDWRDIVIGNYNPNDHIKTEQ